jgi:hypothetical protein
MNGLSYEAAVLACEILLVERLAEEGFDRGLAADIQLLRRQVQFF